MVFSGMMTRSSALLVTCFLAKTGAALAAGATVTAGRGFSIMVDPTHGVAMGVGKNGYGQLGINSTMDILEPMDVMVPEGERVMYAAAGAFHSLFLMASGKVFSVGRNDYGQLGHEGAGLMPMQVMLPEDAAATHIAAGYAHSMILTAGDLYTFGLNNQGQLGDGTLDNKNMPTPVTLPLSVEDSCTNGTQIRGMAAGYDFSYFILADSIYGASCDGMAYAMGNGLGGQLGTGMRDSETMPAKVAVEGISAVDAGDAHAVFLLKSGSWSATGSNFDGQLGVVGEMFSATPVEGSALPDGTDLSSLGAGGDSSCLVGSDKAMAFGSNRQGQLGLGGTMMAATPMLLEGVMDIREWSIGEAHSLLMTKELAVWAMGSNAYGQLGDGTTNSSNTAKKVEQFELPSTETVTTTETTTLELTTTKTATEPSEFTGTKTGTTTKTETMTNTRAGQDAGENQPLTYATIWVAGIVVFASVFLCAVMGQGAGSADDGVELSEDARRTSGELV